MNTLIIGDLHGDRAGLLRLLRAFGAVAGWAQVARCALPLAGGVMATIEEMRALIDAGYAMVTALCAPRDDPEARRWTMSIPARPDHDPDLVIAAALRAGEQALGELVLARAQIARDAPVLSAARDVVLNWECLGRGANRDGLVLMCERLARVWELSLARE